MCSKQPPCFRGRETASYSGGRITPAGRLVFLNPMSAAVEECSQKGCLALSLLELLGFNLTFVFFASLLVLIEVRYDGGEAVGVLPSCSQGCWGFHFSPSPFPKCQDTNLVLRV